MTLSPRRARGTVVGRGVPGVVPGRRAVAGPALLAGPVLEELLLLLVEEDVEDDVEDEDDDIFLFKFDVGKDGV